MPNHIFEKLNQAVLKDKDEVQKALAIARASMPDPSACENRIARFSDAVEALNDPDIPEELKNRYLKDVFEKIIYYRESPVRVTRRNYRDYGMNIQDLKTGGNWYAPPFEVDVTFRN